MYALLFRECVCAELPNCRSFYEILNACILYIYIYVRLCLVLLLFSNIKFERYINIISSKPTQMAQIYMSTNQLLLLNGTPSPFFDASRLGFIPKIEPLFKYSFCAIFQYLFCLIREFYRTLFQFLSHFFY